MNNEQYVENFFLLIDDAISCDEDSEHSNGLALTINIKQEHITILNEFEINDIIICIDILDSNKKRINLAEIQVNDCITLSISPNALKKHLNFGFYFTCNDFLNKNNFKLTSNHYYIKEDNITSLESNLFIDTYKLILQLQQIFEDVSNTHKTTLNKYITYTFFDNKEIEIRSTFTKDDINNIIEKCPKFGILVSKMFKELEVTAEKDIKKLFFKKALEITFKNKTLTFSNILEEFIFIIEEYDAHYRAYINSLEPEKIKHEFEESHNRFLKELNSILGDVHSKIIFIPIAFIFGASQMTDASWQKGAMIIIGMLIFTIFVSLFLSTHNQVLKILNKSIKKKASMYEKKHHSLFLKYEEQINDLSDISKSVKNRILFTRYINWILTIGVSIIYYCLQK